MNKHMIFANELETGAVIVEECRLECGGPFQDRTIKACRIAATFHEPGHTHRFTVKRLRTSGYVHAIVTDENGNEQPWEKSKNEPIYVASVAAATQAGH